MYYKNKYNNAIENEFMLRTQKDNNAQMDDKKYNISGNKKFNREQTLPFGIVHVDSPIYQNNRSAKSKYLLEKMKLKGIFKAILNANAIFGNVFTLRRSGNSIKKI